MEYNFKDIYKSFNLSYFSKNKDLLDNFADDTLLKNYESIDFVDKDEMVILIKRFKLMISFCGTSNFSNEFIISDDFDFDPTLLNFSDSLLKVAVVKNNVDKWISSKNLYNYDYIFAIEDYVNELNEYELVLKINAATIYDEIKFILNELYRKRYEKFNSFIKNTGFDIFPNQKDYFKVLNSEYFDDQWYRDTYNISDNTDCVIHFLLVGSDKGYNPGPDFSTLEYYETNKDVKKARMNALIHYEKYGRKENRLMRISDKNLRDYEVILNSPLFDKDWYERTYDIGEDDSVNHYLLTGYAKGYNPGPDFSTYEYYECNKDVKEDNENPLVHYELFGRKEKRKTHFSDEQHRIEYNIILNSQYFDEEWYESNYDLGRNVDPVSHYLNIGYAKGYNPGPDFSTYEYYECNKDVEEYGMNPLLHYERSGRKEQRKISLNDD